MDFQNKLKLLHEFIEIFNDLNVEVFEPLREQNH